MIYVNSILAYAVCVGMWNDAQRGRDREATREFESLKQCIWSHVHVYQSADSI